ncbi:hypothetical protein [Chryseolinea lacunae]|uniref:Uncharacterized protein n=1 Tax=Chryseolinea lacunae TaxID=2801331 RepID=A0ABS1KTI1_9BACT|nr:hypothetical protein [Chryseolinea lacunae]MBL0742655.1 hypothetical protein [Chryseolinea lacunae]
MTHAPFNINATLQQSPHVWHSHPILFNAGHVYLRASNHPLNKIALLSRNEF